MSHKTIMPCFSTSDDTWETPLAFFNTLNSEFCFTLDPCCSKRTAKCEKYFTVIDDGLSKDWGGEVVFCNPPYGKMQTRVWVKKCFEESLKPNTTIVLLVPSRTDSPWLHNYCYNKAEVRFIKGRLKFGGSKQPAPFPSMLIIFKPGMGNFS